MLARAWTALGLIGRLLTDLLVSSCQLAFDVWTPRDRLRPRVVRLPLDGQTDAELMALSVMTGLTPGTFVVDIADRRDGLYVHTLYAHDPRAFAEQHLRRYVRPLAFVFRGIRP